MHEVFTEYSTTPHQLGFNSDNIMFLVSRGRGRGIIPHEYHSVEHTLCHNHVESKSEQRSHNKKD